ncbi:hypothetical protein DAMA08_047060 [Martiniozyma asiatica (nom. inval.)]|nr:hypothetical protein DAMA08_047060 [Martiniozyma asiatica]
MDNHVRYPALHTALSYALQKTLKMLKLGTFKLAYPNIDKRVLSDVRSKVIKAWSGRAELEFKRVFADKNLESKLNELDDLIFEAQDWCRKDASGEEGVDVTQFTVRELTMLRTLPAKKEAIDELEKQLEAILEANTLLEEELDQLKKGIFKDSHAVESVIGDLDMLDDENLSELKELISWSLQEIQS